ncbi:MAG: hypothetical protein CL868_02385 [Cytophagaceae bacterium]|nr:hypothetical protein [Cytophagaceae bacterium]|tara:strand:+ start:928 stop:1371 length:444 start_codon:yes stop_codon:yes gene_type:complete
MLHKILKIVALILSVLGAIWLLRIVLTGDAEIEASTDLQDSLVTPFMYIAFATLAIILVFVVIFVLKGIFSNPKSFKNTLIGIIIFGVIIGISYGIAHGEETPLGDDGEMLSATGARWVEAGLYVFYILAVLAIAAMVFSGIRKLAK